MAEVEGGLVIEELARASRVTRLGRGVDLSGQLAAEAIEETCAAVASYVDEAGALGVGQIQTIATSAVRDAANSDAFLAELRERFGLEARTLNGLEEARLTYLGAISGADAYDDTLVIDIGGGSTEIVIGSGSAVSAHTSLQLGAVRHSERHIREDPPTPSELELLAARVSEAIQTTISDWQAGVGTEPQGGGRSVAAPRKGIAVAGTATSLAAIDLALDPYDADAVQGHGLRIESVQRMCSQLACLPLEKRREVVGLHPERAPTIVAGVVILIQAMRAFDLAEIEISDRDLLHGAAAEAAPSAER